MIEFDTNAPDVAKQMDALRNEFPKEFRRGMSTLGIAFRSRIRKALRSGHTPDGSVPPLHPLTSALRNRKTKGFGGNLQNALRYRLTGTGADLMLTVGFTASVTAADAAQKMQDNRRKSFTQAQRKWLFGTLVRAKKEGNEILVSAVREALRNGYRKPDRSFIAPFERDLSAEAPRIIKGRIDSILKKEMRGG